MGVVVDVRERICLLNWPEILGPLAMHRNLHALAAKHVETAGFSVGELIRGVIWIFVLGGSIESIKS